MEISEEKLAEIKEQSYLLGRKQLLVGQLGEILRELSPMQDVSKEWLIKERQEAINALRSICEDHGDNDWNDNLHLADIINKHLGDNLYD